jgi:hypothetical protein
LSKKLSAVKVASAACAGILMLSTGLAAAGADGSTTEPAEVTTPAETDTPLVAEPGTDVENSDGGDVVVVDKPADSGDGAGDGSGEPKPDGSGTDGTDSTDGTDGTDGTDDSDGGTVVEDGDGIVVVTIGDTSGDAGDADDDEVEVDEPRPDNHGSTVSEAAGNKDLRGGKNCNHGGAVSAVARSVEPAPGCENDVTPPAVDDDKAKDKDKNKDKVKVDDDDDHDEDDDDDHDEDDDDLDEDDDDLDEDEDDDDE